MPKVKQRVYERKGINKEMSRKDFLFSEFEKAEVFQPSIDEKRYVWEVELEAHRRQKRWNGFFVLGSVCGVLSFLISTLILLGLVVDFF